MGSLIGTAHYVKSRNPMKSTKRNTTEQSGNSNGSRAYLKKKKKMKTMVLSVGPLFLLQRTASTTAILKTQAEALCKQGHLRVLCKQGHRKETLNILHTVDISTYIDLLQRCIYKKALSEGRRIHNQTGYCITRLLTCMSRAEAWGTLSEFWTKLLNQMFSHGLCWFRVMGRAGSLRRFWIDFTKCGERVLSPMSLRLPVFFRLVGAWLPWNRV